MEAVKKWGKCLILCAKIYFPLGLLTILALFIWMYLAKQNEVKNGALAAKTALRIDNKQIYIYA